MRRCCSSKYRFLRRSSSRQTLEKYEGRFFCLRSIDRPRHFSDCPTFRKSCWTSWQGCTETFYQQDEAWKSWISWYEKWPSMKNKCFFKGSLMGMGADIDFKRSTDKIILQDCDDTVQQIVDKLSWKTNFAAIPKNSMKL